MSYPISCGDININRESTITVTGIVQNRTEDMINPNMKTGEIEVNIKSLEVLGECKNVLPFEISRSKESTEDTRLKYRYLDLRNEEVHTIHSGFPCGSAHRMATEGQAPEGHHRAEGYHCRIRYDRVHQGSPCRED